MSIENSAAFDAPSPAGTENYVRRHFLEDQPCSSQSSTDLLEPSYDRQQPSRQVRVSLVVR
jgi:hypothetical protein